MPENVKREDVSAASLTLENPELETIRQITIIQIPGTPANRLY